MLTEDEKVHDQYRIDYLKMHLEQCRLAIGDGVQLFGYCPWSFMELLRQLADCGKGMDLYL